jgi:5-methyltetrahydropteroyltriglutamate--homocysteine methyltransferase
MVISRDRILLAHVGSLPRNAELSDLLVAREGKAVENGRLSEVRDRSGQHIVEKQAAAGVDIGNDELLSLLYRCDDV